MHEKLHEEHGIQIKYSTLTWWLRQLGITHNAKPRCERVPDEPGAEMQHDTSVYTVTLPGQPIKLVASLLYLRYSKRRYLRFYRSFERFKMKCFLHRALLHWGYSARQCIIDNTNLARLRGTGARAIMVPEMEAFARQYGFQFICHEKGHSDRKAGEERSFCTVETNFLPGRSFQSLEDLNHQALEWATVRMEHRPQGKARLIPAKAFEQEQAFLTALLPHLPAPYKLLERSIDEYGYVAFEANYYWTPGNRPRRGQGAGLRRSPESLSGRPDSDRVLPARRRRPKPALLSAGRPPSTPQAAQSPSAQRRGGKTAARRRSLGRRLRRCLPANSRPSNATSLSAGCWP